VLPFGVEQTPCALSIHAGRHISDTVLAVATDIDPQTPADLAKDKDAKVRKAVASNPSTPKEVYIKLAKEKKIRRVRTGVFWLIFFAALLVWAIG